MLDTGKGGLQEEVWSRESSDHSTVEQDDVHHFGSDSGNVRHVQVKTTGKKKSLCKYQVCYYCEKPVLKIARHLMSRHIDEEEIAKIAAKKKLNYHEYRVGIKKVKNHGNFNYNAKILAMGGTELVLARKPVKARKPDEFLPCIFCYGFFVVDELWRHCAHCEFRDDADVDGAGVQKTSIVASAHLLLEGAYLSATQCQTDLFHNIRELVFLTARHDGTYNAIKHDTLILAFGAVLLKKLGPARKNDISVRMRQLG